MRIYQVQSSLGIEGFYKSFEGARLSISKLDPTARKKTTMQDGMESGHFIFSNCYEIFAIDIKNDKASILGQLNIVLQSAKLTAAKIVLSEEKELIDSSVEEHNEHEDPLQNKVEEVADDIPELITPAIKYTVDDVNFPKSGKGTCLHCKKTVGYVGGFPRVNPPAAVCD